jgi:hypothetical protein
MPNTREDLIRRYAEGPTLLRRTLETVPREALKWRPESNKWSVHEVIVHCADSETNAHMRIRYLLGEDEPSDTTRTHGPGNSTITRFH